MTLAADLTTDLTTFFNTDDFAETITYNGSSISAIVDYGAGKLGENARTAQITVKKSDVSSPSYRDTIVIDSVTWRVFRDSNTEVAIAGDGYIWTINLIRDERPVW